MKKTKVIFSAGILLLSASLFSCNKQVETPFGENAEVVQIASGFSFTEGPTSNKRGDVYFTDQPNNLILSYSTEGELDTFSTDAGRSNGLYFDAEDNLWACADMNNQLWKFTMEGEKKIVLNPEGEVAYNGPNDVWVHKNGDAYFTDPYYKRPYWEGAHDTLSFKGVYLLLEGQDSPILLDSTLIQPNGIVGSSTNNLLYVADNQDNKIYRYAIQPDGTVAKRKMLINQGSDGMTLDSEGNIYLTGEGVDVFDSEGKAIRHLDIDEDWTANICFGGKENDELFITASKGLYHLKTNVKGIN